MYIEKQDKYLKKLEELERDQKLTTQEVDCKISDIRSIAERLNTVTKSEKKALKKRLNSGKMLVKVQSDRKYVIEFFYNKNDDKIVLNNIIEYEKINKKPMIWIDIILSIFTIYELCNNIKIQNNLIPWILISFIIILNIITLVYYSNEKNDRFSLVGKDWLDKLLLHLDHLEEIEKFRVSRVILFLLLYLIYSSFLIIDKLTLCEIVTNLVCFGLSIYMFIRNLFKVTKLNFFYFIIIVFLAILGGSVQTTNWEAIVALIAIISLLFSDEIWKISSNYENPLAGKYQSKKNKETVERNIFKYKLILSVLSLVLFIVIEILGDHNVLGSILLGEKVKELETLPILIFKGLDRFIIGFLLVAIYLILKLIRKVLLNKGMEFEKPILDRLFQFIYKDLELTSPIVKSNIEIDKGLANIFEPKTLIENLDDLPDNIIVNIEKPVKNGKNILFIQYSDGRVFLKKEVNIKLKNR